MLQGLLDIDTRTTSAAATDPFFGSVVLLMGFEGANGSTGAPGLTDESPSAHGTASSGASSTIETAQFKFGTSSYRMHSAIGNSCIFSSDSLDWRLSTANSDQFTVEGWVRLASFGSGRYYMAQNGVAGNLAWTFENGSTSTTDIEFTFSTDGTAVTTLESVGANFLINTWYAIAVDKDSGGKIRIYKDGAMIASSTPADSSMFNSTAGLGIASNGAANRIDGWVDEWRITKGVARYASDSGYTPATAAFPRS